MKNIFLILLLSFFYLNPIQDNYKDYYFPIESQNEVNIYKYVDKNYPKTIEYWKVTTDSKANIILTESYTSDFRLYNVFEEILKTDGAELISYSDFVMSNENINTEIKGKVGNTDVYKWYDNESYSYSVEYTRPDLESLQFTKYRRKNSFETIMVNGIEYSTIMFKDDYITESLDNDQSYEFYQYTYYAKGIGMVEYRRHYNTGEIVNLELVEVLNQNQFDELIKNTKE